MKIQIKDKPAGNHVNPNLTKGHVYQNIDSKQYYIAGSVSSTSSYIILINLDTGANWATEGGFGTGRFKDVTGDLTLVVEV